MLRKSRLLAAPVTALALVISPLAVPFATAATVSVSDWTCSVSHLQSDTYQIRVANRKYGENYSKLMYDQLLKQAPEARPMFEKLGMDDPDNSEALYQLLISKGFTGMLLNHALNAAELHAKGKTSKLAYYWRPVSPQSREEASALVSTDIYAPFVHSNSLFTEAEFEQVKSLLRANKIDEARSKTFAIAKEKYLAQAITDMDKTFAKGVVDKLPYDVLDRHLYDLWVSQACAEGITIDQPYFTASVDDGGSPGVGSADSTEIAQIFGILFGFSAIGALIGSLVFWLQQQGMIR